MTAADGQMVSYWLLRLGMGYKYVRGFMTINHMLSLTLFIVSALNLPAQTSIPPRTRYDFCGALRILSTRHS